MLRSILLGMVVILGSSSSAFASEYKDFLECNGLIYSKTKRPEDGVAWRFADNDEFGFVYEFMSPGVYGFNYEDNKTRFEETADGYHIYQSEKDVIFKEETCKKPDFVGM